MVPSRKTAPDPMIVATRVQRWRQVIAGSVAGVRHAAARLGHRDRLSACPDPWRSSAPVNSFPRWPSSTAELLAPTGSSAPARRHPADRLVPRRRGRLRSAGRRWASPISGSSAPRSSRSSCATAPRPTTPAAAQAIGEADLIYLSGGKPGYLLRVLDGQRGRRGARSTPTSAARSWPAARPGRWSSPGTPSTSGCACCRGRCAGVGPRVRAGDVGRAALRRVARADVRAGRAAGAARVGRCWDRRGDRGHRPGRGVAGPRRVARHGLARPPPRTLSRGRGLPGLNRTDRRPWDAVLDQMAPGAVRSGVGAGWLTRAGRGQTTWNGSPAIEHRQGRPEGRTEQLARRPWRPR